MTTHLLKRDGGMYYFRRAVPVALRPAFDGRREWVYSLGTKDRAEAKALIPHYVLATDQRLASAKAGGGEPKAVPTGVAKRIGAAGLPFASENASIALQGREPVASTVGLGSPAVPLLATFEAYSKEQRLKPSTAAEWLAMLRVLVAFIGHDDAAKLSPADLDRWRDHLLSEPTRRGTLRDPGTVKDKYLCCVRATLGWAVEKRLLPQNVASSVRVRVPRKPKLRERDFRAEEVIAILSAALMRPSGGLRPEDVLARRWVPWICAYTGARVNEIGQLRGSDVREIGGIWTMTITPEAGTVKGDAARIVPLHEHLIEQGIIDLARCKGGAPMAYDPTRIISPGPANRYYKKVGERLRDWVRGEVGISDPHVQPNHGWRHTFKARCIDAAVPERVADAIQGHAPKTVGQGYGSVSLLAKAKAVRSLPRFDLSARGGNSANSDA